MYIEYNIFEIDGKPIQCKELKAIHRKENGSLRSPVTLSFSYKDYTIIINQIDTREIIIHSEFFTSAEELFVIHQNVENILMIMEGFFVPLERIIFDNNSTNVYSLIDSIFIKGQPQTNSLKLAEKAVGLLNKDDKVKHFVTAKATINVVQELYKSASNFSISDHNNRNMMSHGMNIDNPDKTDTIKLFVLLFNILVLFKHNIFVWKQRNSNDEKA